MCTLLIATFAAAACAQSVGVRRWEFVPDPNGSYTIQNLQTAKGWRPAVAGMSWQAQFDDLRNYMGYAWYRTTLQVPRFADARRVLLRFGAVDYRASVFVNGKAVGEHEGGYTPFVFDITSTVHPGDNSIAVRVLDPPDKGELGGLRYSELPHGKQSWYVQTSGLWQPVTLEFRPQTYIDQVWVTPELDGHITMAITLAGNGPAAGDLNVAVRDRHGAVVMEKRITTGASKQYEISGQVGNPELWSPDDPALYSVEATLASDSYRTRFGFRRLEARGGKLYLNGRPFYMIGALDQDFYPDTIYSPPSAAYVRREMEAGKKLGLNTLRCHIKVCEPEYLDAADEAGMLVWYEIPNWDHFSAVSADRGEETLEEMVARDWNHPSIVIQSIINESWGIDLKQPEQRAWLSGMYDRAHKRVAPLGRLIVDNSACCENFHVHTDIDDFHQYYSIPDHAAQWDKWVADFASNPKWTFSPYGDAKRSGNEPLVVSEFGNWGLPELPENLPWWFKRDKGDEITHPEGVRERFSQYKFNRIFKDYNDLARATQWHQFLSLKHEIEQIRSHAPIQGYVITEFTDLNWESNGLLTMWRDPKAYAKDLSDIQQPDVIFARFDHHDYKPGDTAHVTIELSHFSTRALKNATVYWWTSAGQSGRVDIADQPVPASTAVIGHVPVATAGATRASTVRLFLALRDVRGDLIATNQEAITVVPAVDIGTPTVAFYDPSGALPHLQATLVGRGYRVRDDAGVMLATRWDDHVRDYVERGGHAVVLADAADALPANAPVHLQQRKGDYDGNWISNFAWIVPQSPLFRDIAFGRILGWEAAAVTPDFVLTGVPAGQYDDVLAGMFYGWLRNNSPLLLQARAGQGSAIVTTFRFDQYGADPYATALLDSIVRYASSNDFHPKTEWER